MSQDISSRRLKKEEYQDNFCDLHPPLTLSQATIEANRCYFCYDAPCIEACPTGIDIPSFIRKISTGNLKGSAKDILSANIMGGTCARVCPVEVLCQQSCVRNTNEDKPVEIGHLQRFATDEIFQKQTPLFARAPETGKKIAVIGAGPAGLSCAHRLAMHGHTVDVFEAKPKSGGLNEYGLAAYKVVEDFVQREIDYILSIGGIEVHHGKGLGQEIQLEDLRKSYDGVFIGVGLGAKNDLGLKEFPGVLDAVDYIEQIRQTSDLSSLPVGRRVVVIGGGNTAVDMAVQIKRLGAETVHMVYRRGKSEMGATQFERDLAQTNGVTLRYWAKPEEILGSPGGVTGIRFERTQNVNGKLQGTGEFFTLEADQIFKAIGQSLSESKSELKIQQGKIWVDENQQTNLPGVYAGGDCALGGEDLTVTAVEHGKRAAEAIHTKLCGAPGGKHG